jgi:hypothetical protein
MSDIDSKVFVRAVEKRAATASQRDIENALAHESARASGARTITVPGWRRVVGRLGHYLVAVSERPSRAPHPEG